MDRVERLVFIGPHASETKCQAAGRSRLSEPSFGPAPNAAAAPTMGYGTSTRLLRG